jgi:TetR/AcrR family transcriptional regulator, transcriptional repressor for nem operon
MGHSKAQKAATHERLVAIAATRFRELGLDGLSVGDLMKEAGLTVGGFYKHFESREALVQEAVAAAMAASDARSATRTSAAAALDAYLSPEHRDDPGGGCAIGALACDAGRATAETRALFTQQIERRLRSITQDVAPPEGMTDREAAIVKLSTLVGALSLARATAGDTVSLEILETVKAFLGEMFGGEPA